MALKNEETIAFKLSDEDKRLLRERADKERLSVSAYIRTKLFNKN